MAEVKKVDAGKMKALKKGDYAQCTVVVTEKDGDMYAVITGDHNPVHMDEEYAKSTVFGGRIAHGMYLAGVVSKLLGMEVPGPGAVYVKQVFEFLKPVRFNDFITARVEVVENVVEKGKIRLKTVGFNQHGAQVMDGEALLSYPKG